MTEAESKRGDGWRTLIRVSCLALVLFGVADYVWDRLPTWGPLSIPLAPLVVSPDLPTADSLDARPGALRGYDVILVTLDTTRPDRLGCYGNAEISTPNLDRLAAEGVIFSSAVATGPTTLPTHASILTGLYPQRHGARANSLYRLEEDQVSIAEVLSDAGYETGAFVSSFVLDARFGLAQGFDHYDAEVGTLSGVTAYAERRADETTDGALDWLRRRQGPYFLWVHYYDPHAAYDPPSPYREDHALIYDGEIAFVDHELGRILQAVAKRSRKTLVVVVGDHGEAGGEHGELSHGHLLQEATLRIPLILHATSGLDRGLHVSARVSQVDVMPTVLSLLGLGARPDLDGVPLTRPHDGERAVIAEAVEGRAQYGWARLSAIYRGALKYVHGPNPELYDLAQDPLERSDIVSERSSDAASLRELLRGLEGSQAESLDGWSVELSASDLLRLEALGYGTGVAPISEGRGADPKAMLPALLELQMLTGDYAIQGELTLWDRLARRLSGQPRVDDREELIAELERLAAEHPDFAPVQQYLAFFYEDENRPADAERARREFEARTRRN